MFDGARFQKIYFENDAANTPSRRVDLMTDYDILQKLVLVAKNKQIRKKRHFNNSKCPFRHFKKRTTYQLNHDNFIDEKTEKSSSNRIKNNFEDFAPIIQRSARRKRKEDIEI